MQAVPQPPSEVADVGDLYDELSFGQKSPGAIQDFLKRTKAATNDSDVRRTWILFGDPTTKVKY